MCRTAWFALIPVAVLAAANPGLGAPQERRTPVERLSPDLVPFIPDPNAVLAVVKVISCAVTPLAREQKEQLTVQLEPVDVIHGEKLKPGGMVEISGKRLADEEARFRSHFDKWNVLPFQPGDLLAVALAPTQNSAVWIALAAQQVVSVKDSVVGALRRAASIERMPPESQVTALEEALSSPSDLLQRYAIEALGRRGLVARLTGAEMIARALFSARILPAGRPPLAMELASRDFYHYEDGAGPANVIVIQTLSRLLVEGGASQQALWTQLLGASLTIEFSKDPQTDAGMRSALIRAVQDPGRVMAALEQQAAQGSKDPRVPKLISAWKEAGAR